MHANANSGKLRITLIISWWLWSNMGMGLNFNEWMNLADFFHTNTYSRNLKVTLIFNGCAWSNMGMAF